MLLPKISTASKIKSIDLGGGMFDFFRRHLFQIFFAAWFITMVIVVAFMYVEINRELNAPIAERTSAKFKLEKLDTSIFNNRIFKNLRTVGSRPQEIDYKQCLGVPGRPSAFTEFVPCP